MRLTISTALALALSLTCLASVAVRPDAGAQSELDRAVLEYESGRLDQARGRFEVLARRGVPAALFNLATMHLRGEMPRPDLIQARRCVRGARRPDLVWHHTVLSVNAQGFPIELIGPTADIGATGTFRRRGSAGLPMRGRLWQRVRNRAIRRASGWTVRLISKCAGVDMPG